MIQTFKIHTIAGLRTCDEKFPSVLWCKLIKQSQYTLNMLWTYHIHPQLPEYHVLEVPNNFNRFPFSLPGCRAPIFNPPKKLTSWGPRAIDSRYCSPAYKHYRPWKLHIQSTGIYQTSAQSTFYPKHFTMPNEAKIYTTKIISTIITRAIQKIRKYNRKFQGRHGEALQQPAKCFVATVEKIAPTLTTTNKTSSTKSAPTHIRIAPHTHQHFMR